MTLKNRPRYPSARAGHTAAILVLGAVLAAGANAAASPVKVDSLGDKAPASGASSPIFSVGNGLTSGVGHNIAGLASAVHETMRTVVVGTPSPDPYWRAPGPVPLSRAPAPVPEPATMALLAAGCLAVLGLCRRTRPTA